MSVVYSLDMYLLTHTNMIRSHFMMITCFNALLVVQWDDDDG
jgi:hypothetical protein